MKKGTAVQQIDLKWFDIGHTLYCGQIFRFYKIAQNVYCVISQDKWCVLTQFADKVQISTQTPEYFDSFFDIDTDYSVIESTLSKFDELATPIAFCKGLRILHQDLVETIISFIISACNRIDRITKTLNTMCQSFGNQFFCDYNQTPYYTFPDLSTLSKISVSDWASFGAGYRSQYLYQVCNVLAHSDIVSELKVCDYTQGYKKLIGLKGVGPKVANCILLFGLSHCASFPVDTWIFNSLKTTELNTEKKVHSYYTNRYGKMGGYAQQYIFYYNRTIKQQIGKV